MVLSQPEQYSTRPLKRSLRVTLAPRNSPVVQAAARQTAINRRLQAMNRVNAGFLGIEKKFYDTGLVATAITASTNAAGGEYDPSATSMISTPPQGDGESSRDGKQITCEYVEVKGAVGYPFLEAQVNPPQQCNVFVALVLDTQSNGAQMNSEDCFKNAAAANNVAQTPLRNLLYGRRFRILKSQTFELNPKCMSQEAANLFSWGGNLESFSWFVPLKGMKINFNAGTTASIANVVDNSLHIIAYCSLDTIGPTLAYQARLRFMG